MNQPIRHIDRTTVQEIIQHNMASKHDLFVQMHQYKQDHPKLEDTHVIDPTQSVNWNETEVQHRNNHRNDVIGAYTTKINQCTETITQAIMDYIHDTHGLDKHLAIFFYTKACENCHTAGYQEILDRIDEYADFAQQILDASK